MLVVHTNEDGYSRLALHDPATAALRRRVELPDDGTIERLVVSPDGSRLAYGFSSPRLTWDVWLLETATGASERLTRSPTTIPEDALVAPTLHRFASFDAESIPYFAFHPASSGAAPVILEIHGGPEAQRRPTWMPVVQHLVAQGFAVVQPNVRGSTGYGKRFEHLDDGRRRLDTVRDVATLHDRLRQDDRARRRQDRALRRVVRRVHGARLPRLRAGSLGRRGRGRADLQLRHLPAEHVGVPARLPRAGVRLARARPRVPRRGLADHARRPDPLAAPPDPRRQRPAGAL